MSTASGISRIEQGASLRDTVETAVASAIISGQLEAGLVVSVPALAARFDVSATPVREAMLNLAKRGRVVPLRNKGFRVTEVDESLLEQLAQVRHLLEPEAMAELAAVFTPEMVKAGRRLADAIVTGAARRDLPVYLLADHDFHLGLLRHLGNPVLESIVSDLRQRTRLGGLTRLLQSDLLAASAAEHHELLDLLAAHDAAGARALMHRHIGHVVGWWAGNDERPSRVTVHPE
jgi:DNA-binding GntR family transcriptional regulator